MRMTIGTVPMLLLTHQCPVCRRSLNKPEAAADESSMRDHRIAVTGEIPAGTVVSCPRCGQVTANKRVVKMVLRSGIES